MTRTALRGEATTDYLDRCADPESAGVIGIRKFPNPSGGPPLIGITCAACHAGFDPVDPPFKPESSVGNQYLQIGKIFRAHLSRDEQASIQRTSDFVQL